MSVFHRDGFSTAVRIFLHVNGRELRVAQVGENSLILRDLYVTEPTSDAQVVIHVDSERHVYPVVLRKGIQDKLVFVDDDMSGKAVENGQRLLF